MQALPLIILALLSNGCSFIADALYKRDGKH
jgi:hypothetical protein